MANIVSISGMFGTGRTFFTDSPVVITISGLAWPSSSPFTVVQLDVVYNGSTVGEFRADTAGQTTISFDISSALRALWSDYEFAGEVAKAQLATSSSNRQEVARPYRSYSLSIHTEYISNDGVLTTTTCVDGNGNSIIPGGQCSIGAVTERERSIITDLQFADVSQLQGSNNRYGDASTKPLDVPERVGSTSITSWVDISAEGTTCVFWHYSLTPEADSTSRHVPQVIRDSVVYTDFLFVNRRGAVETCSARMLDAMDITTEVQQYARVERPSFIPSRSLMSIASGGRRSWSMSSGYQTRKWAEWWALEFLMARRHWMRYNGTATFVPVIVEPAQKSTGIYNLTKQEMPSVEFTVTLALEG